MLFEHQNGDCFIFNDLYRSFIAIFNQSFALHQNFNRPRDVYDGNVQRSSKYDQNQPGIFSPVLATYRDTMMEEERLPTATGGVCESGFVEHCLVAANQYGERRVLESLEMKNLTESGTIVREFDGMCTIVLQFIDCLNLHHRRCGGHEAQQFSKNRDLFLESWTGLCDPQGETRARYLKNAACIKNALSEDDGQEKCQSRIQYFFMSGQFSLDSPEAAVHFGCCAFNEWQHCIDS